MRSSWVRRLSRIVAAALVGAVAVAIPPARAGAGPVAPYDAFTLNGAAGSWLLSSGEYNFDASNATIGATGSTTRVSFGATTPTHWWYTTLAAPTGGTLVPGTTYPTARFADALHAGLDVGGDGRGCNQATGSMTVTELTVDPATSALTALAVTYSESCEGTMPAVTGEMRWHSSVSYVAVGATPTSIDFGAQIVGVTGTPQTVTVTGAGGAAATLGTATLTGPAASDFLVTADGCAGTALAYGQTCTVTVAPRVTATNTRQAQLVIPDSTVAVHRLISLSATGAAAVQITPPSVAFGTQPVGQVGGPLPISVAVNSATPIVFGRATITGPDASTFSIGTDSCSNTSFSQGTSCTISITVHPTTTGPKTAQLVLPDNTAAGSEVVPLSVNSDLGVIGTYYPLPQARLLDTRNGTGARVGPLGPQGTLHLQVAGRGGVPATGVSAVVLNVTVTGPTAASHLTVYPTGVTRPTASSLNFAAGWTGANSVTVSLGTGGQVDIFNNSGSTHVIADVVGFYAGTNDVLMSNGTGDQYQLATPQRLLDTRTWGAGPVPAGYYVTLPVDYGTTLNPHLRALAVNVTAVNPGAAGHLTVWDGQSALPLASTLNFVAHVPAVPNLAIVPVAPCAACGGLPSIGIYNASAGATHLVVDVFGVFDDGTVAGGLRFRPMTPTRIVDTRIALGAPHALGPAGSVAVTAPSSVAPAGTTAALVLNVTAVGPTANTHITVWPSGPMPVVSNLNPSMGQTVPNAVIAELDPSSIFNIYNNSGITNIVVDVVGAFGIVTGPPGAPVRAVGTLGGSMLVANTGLRGFLTPATPTK
jgi:hypothetical protein